MDPTVIHRFLESVGGKADIDLYLRLFREERKESFAILVVDAKVVRSALDPLHFDLRILAGLGLTPVVFVGVVDPLDADRQADRVAQSLSHEDAGGNEDAVPAQVVPSDRPLPDLVHQLRQSLQAGVIPVVWAGRSGESSVEGRFGLLAELAAALETRKLVFLGARAGLARAGAVPPSVVNLTLDYEALSRSPTLTRKQTALLRQVRRLFGRVQHRMSVSVTNPLHLLRELFTVKGAGTLIRPGVQIERHDGFDGVDRERLAGLLSSSFGHPLRPSFLDRPVERSYVVEGYQGAALVTASPVGPYLTKFAVERQAQGEGLGADLWTVLTRDYPSFFWRARSQNPITPWYVKQCDGMQRMGDWQVFWRGMPTEQIDGLVRWALQAPEDFEPA